MCVCVSLSLFSLSLSLCLCVCVCVCQGQEERGGNPGQRERGESNDTKELNLHTSGEADSQRLNHSSSGGLRGAHQPLPFQSLIHHSDARRPAISRKVEQMSRACPVFRWAQRPEGWGQLHQQRPTFRPFHRLGDLSRQREPHVHVLGVRLPAAWAKTW